MTCNNNDNNNNNETIVIIVDCGNNCNSNNQIVFQTITAYNLEKLIDMAEPIKREMLMINRCVIHPINV